MLWGLSTLSEEAPTPGSGPLLPSRELLLFYLEGVSFLASHSVFLERPPPSVSNNQNPFLRSSSSIRYPWVTSSSFCSLGAVYVSFLFIYLFFPLSLSSGGCGFLLFFLFFTYWSCHHGIIGKDSTCSASIPRGHRLESQLPHF